MVQEQAHLPLGAGQARDRELRLTQRGPRDRQGIDRIRLAALAAAFARTRHQLRRHAHDLLAAGEEEALERDGHMPAVLEREQALLCERTRPDEQLLVAARRG